MPNPVAAVIGGSSLLGASSANRAAKAQTAASQADLKLRERIYDETTQRFQPFYDIGLKGQNALAFELGLGDKPEGYGGFTATPGYDFRMKQGINALDASAASQGNLFSGAAGKALTEYGQGIGSQEYNNYLTRLTGQASSGQNAAGQQAAAGQNYAQGASNAYDNIGNAKAAGAIGVGNALTGGINNYLGYMQYNNTLNRMYPGAA